MTAPPRTDARTEALASSPSDVPVTCALPCEVVVRVAACYERLRARMTGEREQVPTVPATRSTGLALILDDGLPAWLHAITRVLLAASAETVAPPRSRAVVTGDAAREASVVPAPALLASELVPAAQQCDLAMLLANLVLSTRLPPRGAVHSARPAAPHVHHDHRGYRC